MWQVEPVVVGTALGTATTVAVAVLATMRRRSILRALGVARRLTTARKITREHRRLVQDTVSGLAPGTTVDHLAADGSRLRIQVSLPASASDEK